MGQPHHHGDGDLLGDLPDHLVDLIRMDREVLHLGPDGGEQQSSSASAPKRSTAVAV